MGHLAKGEDLHGDQTLGELRRQYHCAAFNMVAAVITCTQKDLKFYTTFLFKEDLTKVIYIVHTSWCIGVCCFFAGIVSLGQLNLFRESVPL